MVQINDETPIIAGADDLGTLNATVTCVGTLGSGGEPMDADESADLFITLTGLTSTGLHVPNAHLNWLSQRPLKIGDVISVQVIDTLTVDAPVSERLSRT